MHRQSPDKKMDEAEKFIIWLETLYPSPNKGGLPITSGTTYRNGVRQLGIQLNIPNDGIFNISDLQRLADLRQDINNLNLGDKNYSSHFNAFVKYKEFVVENAAKSSGRQVFRQPDVFKRQQVESAAIKTVKEHFEKLNFMVDSVEKDNVGWDLEAVDQDNKLLLEVKGLSGKTIAVELSPNEYYQSQVEQIKYRLCIVTNALTTPTLYIFSFDIEINKWTSDSGHTLLLEKIIGARLKLD
jgi:hypothetical protein